MNKIIEMIKYRGFHIEKINDKYYVKKETYLDDKFKEASYLNKMLKEANVGEVNNRNRIVINDETKINKLHNILFDNSINYAYGGESVVIDYDFKNFSRQLEFELVPLYGLEPYIARYVNALRICGMDTADSCDGNHSNREEVMYVICYDAVSSIYNDVVWEKILSEKFKLKWINKYATINITENKQAQYDELNKAAEYLENNKDTLIKIKKDIIGGIKGLDYKTNEEREEFIKQKIESIVESNKSLFIDR